MTTLLVLALLLAFLLGQAAATSPTMQPSLYPSPMASFYPDPDGMLDAICELCGISINYCAHAFAYPQRPPTFTEATFLEHPEWPRDSLPELDVQSDFEMEEAQPQPQPPAYSGRQPSLHDNIVRELDDDATSMQRGTIQVHIEGTYNVLDRIAPPPGSRRPTHRRHAPRPGGGYSCTQCAKTFDRSCDLKRHAKTHLERSERPHKCPVCNEGFLYPKDRQRHERTHDQSSSLQVMMHCDVAGCDNVTGFSRRDNLRRHQRKQHPYLFTI